MPIIPTLPPCAHVILMSLLIFALRVVGIASSTLRMLIMMRGHKLLSATVGFFEVLVYAVAIGQVINNLNNPWYLLSYCLGFSVGTLLGMWLEERLALGFVTVQIVSVGNAQGVAEAIREAGYGATVSWGEGVKGTVGIVRTVIRRKNLKTLTGLATRIDANAFVTVEEARAVQRGHLRVEQHER